VRWPPASTPRGASCIVTLDADGQDVPAELPKLIAALEGDRLDLVGGWRRDRDDRFSKRMQSRLYNAATRRMTGLSLHDFNTGYKLFRPRSPRSCPCTASSTASSPCWPTTSGSGSARSAVQHRPRQAGRSKYLSVLRFPKTCSTC
jgi:hypothetical protein